MACFLVISCLTKIFIFKLDIDECAINTANCTHKCDNTDGAYNCSCYENYELQDNGKCTAGKWSANLFLVGRTFYGDIYWMYIILHVHNITVIISCDFLRI